MPLQLKIPAFSNGGEIPRRYTCSGADLSPALQWGGVSPAARSLAIVADDPDAPRGTWTHWLLWNLPAHMTNLPEALPRHEVFPNGARQGTNDFQHIGYNGPCPPPGKPHRYVFKLYVLNTTLDLRGSAGRQELDRAMKKHVLAQTDWMGRFGR